MEFKKNIIGTQLEPCSLSPMTGFKRDGYCNSDRSDIGKHIVCSILTQEFLEFTKHRGNDLSTQNTSSKFPGLKPDDKWCLCAHRWKEAMDNGVAPPVVLSATSEAVLEIVKFDDLLKYAVDD